MIFIFDSPSITKNKNYNEQFDELTGNWNNGYQFVRNSQKIAANLPKQIKLFNSNSSYNFRKRWVKFNYLKCLKCQECSSKSPKIKIENDQIPDVWSRFRARKKYERVWMKWENDQWSSTSSVSHVRRRRRVFAWGLVFT